MKNLITICSIIIFSFGCEKDNSSNYPTNLNGKWSWVLSCPGEVNSGSACWSPGSKYLDYTISFDLKSNDYVFQNDTVKLTDKFQILKSSEYNGKDTVLFIKFASGHLDLYSITHDTLHLTNSEGILTITSHYKKIK